MKSSKSQIELQNGDMVKCIEIPATTGFGDLKLKVGDVGRIDYIAGACYYVVFRGVSILCWRNQIIKINS